MNATLLIDSIVRQTTVLIAQLATATGARTPLAHTANQVFLDLVAELKDQGLGNKVIADMFGIALRTYHAKVQRLSESKTFRGRSVSTAVLDYVQGKQSVSRAQVLNRFRQDDERVLRGVLTDLVDSGLLFRSGRGDQTTYRARTAEDVADDGSVDERIAQLLWVTIHRFGPLTRTAIAEHLHVEPTLLTSALDRLERDGRASQLGTGPDATYRADDCVIPVGDETGWEASVFDHYQAVVTTICAKLRSGSTRARSEDMIGGSTYTYDVWPGHPHYAEVVDQLGHMRRAAVTLREKVEAFNAQAGLPDESNRQRIISYVGQTVVHGDPDVDGAETDEILTEKESER